MPTGRSNPQRWTRSHERLILAFERLHLASARRRLNAWRACLEGYVAVPPAGPTATATATGHWWKGIPGMRRKAARRARRLMTGEAAA